MRLLFALVMVAWAGLAAAVEVGGVKLDDKVRIAPNTPELVLNGGGIRTRIIVKVYVAGLYLTEKKSSPDDVLALGGPKRMALTMLRDVTAQQFYEALNDGFKANNAAADQERYKPQLDALNAVMVSLGQVKKGDAIAIDFLPENGTRVLVNNEQKGKPIVDDGFYRALLRVWLGDRPVDSDLKRGLLGQAS
jgi:Chalcone isomerase-like